MTIRRKVTFILNVDPLLEPSNGPNYFPFDPDVLYTIKIDNNYDAVEDISLRISISDRSPRSRTCSPASWAPATASRGVIPPAITALDGPGAAGLSLRQRYTVTMVKGAGPAAVRTDLTPHGPALRRALERGPAHHAELPVAREAGHLQICQRHPGLRRHRGRPVLHRSRRDLRLAEFPHGRVPVRNPAAPDRARRTPTTIRTPPPTCSPAST